MDFDDIEKLLREPIRNPFGPFSKVVAEYDAVSGSAKRPTFQPNDGIADAVLQNGVPKSEADGHPVDWHIGLAAFCSRSSRGVIGEIAAEHFDAMVELYRVWEDIEGSTFAEPMYRPRGTPVGDPKARGAQLVPRLGIPDRDQLSDHYINSVLRPYAQAEIALRRRFFKAIQASHKNREWIGFRPIHAGRFVPIHPFAGFDGKGGYAIDRATYLEGFGISEDEFGTANFPHMKPYESQESWVFLVAECGSLLTSPCLQEEHPGAQTRSNRIGRPKGTGFDNQDAPFVAMGVQFIKDRRANSATEAARLILIDHFEEIAGNGEWESKQSRIRNKIIKALK
jgi:hypothetical protein